MSRSIPGRVAVTAGLTFATATVGLVFAPGALAVGTLTTPAAPTTVVAGEAFTVSGTGCVAEDATTYDALVVLATDLSDLTAIPPTGIFTDDPADDGTWSAQVTLPADATGEHTIYAACAFAYATDAAEYPEITVTVTAPVTGTPAPKTEAPKTEAPTPSPIRGTAANTPGVASPDTGSATGDSAKPGSKIVKILTGFQPGERVTVTLHSTPTVVGTFTADSDGVVTAEFTLPAGTADGTHTLVYAGSDGTYFQESLQVTSATTTASDSLAYTGASVGLPLALGAGLLVAGGGALVAARRRSGASQA